MPVLVPPLHVFVPWCTESFQLPSTYQNGKLLALELLCRVYVVSQYNDDYHMDYTSLSQFYQLLHQCLLDSQGMIQKKVFNNLNHGWVSLIILIWKFRSFCDVQSPKIVFWGIFWRRTAWFLSTLRRFSLFNRTVLVRRSLHRFRRRLSSRGGAAHCTISCFLV